MKKILFALTLILGIGLSNTWAQGGGQMDPAQMLEMMKQRVKPGMMEKTKLTDAQCDKVLEIQLWSQSQRRGMRDLSPEERATKTKEIQTEVEKKYKAIPLTDAEIKAVNDFYEELRKAQQQMRGGGGK